MRENSAAKHNGCSNHNNGPTFKGKAWSAAKCHDYQTAIEIATRDARQQGVRDLLHNPAALRLKDLAWVEQECTTALPEDLFKLWAMAVCDRTTMGVLQYGLHASLGRSSNKQLFRLGFTGEGIIAVYPCPECLGRQSLIRTPQAEELILQVIPEAMHAWRVKLGKHEPCHHLLTIPEEITEVLTALTNLDLLYGKNYDVPEVTFS